MNRLKYPAQLADMLDLTACYAKLVRDEIGAGHVLRHYRTPGLLNGDLWLLWSGNMASSRPGSDEPGLSSAKTGYAKRKIPYAPGAMSIWGKLADVAAELGEGRPARRAAE